MTNDDGPDAYGVQLLRRCLRRLYPDARIITLTPTVPAGGQALSLSCRDLENVAIEQVEPDWYVCDARPADLVYLGLDYPKRFLPAGQFRMLFAGINHGANVGMDVFHSGTVGMAMLASLCYQLPAIALSQEIADGEPMRFQSWPGSFETAARSLETVLRMIQLRADSCLNVNFPASRPRGWKFCPVSRKSRFRAIDGEQCSNGKVDDVACLAEAHVTISFLSLRVNI